MSKTTKKSPRERSVSTLYVYAKPANKKHAHTYGQKNFGSTSAYIDALIAADKKKKFVSIPVVISKMKAKNSKKAVKKSSKKSLHAPTVAKVVSPETGTIVSSETSQVA